jgi:two-component system phosphate regulon sensor histidine kinase PhoR
VQKRLLYILIGLMSLSLIGIITVQIYWIVDSISKKEEQFSFAMKQTLSDVVQEVELREVRKYYLAFENLADSLGVRPDRRELLELMYVERDGSQQEISRYKNSLLTESYKLDPQLLELDLDSITFTRLYNATSKKIANDNLDGSGSKYTTVDKIIDVEEYQLIAYRDLVRENNHKLPITFRTSAKEIQNLIEAELQDRGIDTDFEFAIFQQGYPTRIASENFQFEENATWSHSIFESAEKGALPYKLLINIPGREKVILSSVTGMALLSLLFTAVIVIAYSNAINQIFKQRQISQIKTDFINNMTHEFKTPIATINLALDSLKHPKIASDPERVKSYLRMIREENKRMHSQVENVLQISKLEKNELNIEKQRVDLNEIIDDAISHISLILEQHNGLLQTHFGALRTEVLGNESHLSNVVVNILENAIKYSSDSPVIDIYTENYKDLIVVKVRDQGIGMSKSVSRKVFQKFYREHTGDIHNVKGHGLGMAYSKRIIEDHHGHIYVESEKGKGSTFTFQLPLIT